MPNILIVKSLNSMRKRSYKAVSLIAFVLYTYIFVRVYSLSKSLSLRSLILYRYFLTNLGQSSFILYVSYNIMLSRLRKEEVLSCAIVFTPSKQAHGTLRGLKGCIIGTNSSQSSSILYVSYSIVLSRLRKEEVLSCAIVSTPSKQAHSTLRGLKGYIIRTKYALKKYLTVVSRSQTLCNLLVTLLGILIFPSITSLLNIYIRFIEFDIEEVRYKGK